MESVNMKDLDALLEKGRELKTLLQETPEILSFLKLTKELGEERAVLPVAADTLIRAQTAAEILCVGKHTIYQYVKDGLLHAYLTPGSAHRKFWLSEVKAIAKGAETT